jgi:ubiquinone/menaquinone biosynthesis C-methylase UbiE
VSRIISHYGEGLLLDRICKALVANGKNLESLCAKDLKAVDEFHIGGEKFSDHLFDKIAISPTSRVLDIGSGLGGTPRYLATKYPGIQVHGIDLTPEYTDVSRSLTAMCGITGLKFTTGSATSLSADVEDNAYDLVSLIHVGMNIEDKDKLFTEVFRALKPGGTFAIFDVMMGKIHFSALELEYPLPWASDASHSFVRHVSAYTEAAGKAGFEVRTVVDRSDAAIKVMEKTRMAAAAAAAANAACSTGGGDEKAAVSPLSIAITMGSNAMLKIRNLSKQVMSGAICPHEIICIKPK